MCHVAAEMERQGFDAAAADRRRDHQPRAHRGEDPSELPARADGLCQRREPRGRRGAGADVARGARRIRRRDCAPNTPRIAAAHARAQEDKQRLSLAGRARQCAEARLVRRYVPPKPSFLGSARVRTTIPIAELVDYIDWTPFFQTWELDRQIPGDPRRREVRRGGALALRRRAGDAGRDRRRRAGSRPRAVRRLLAGERAGRRHRGVRRRRARRADRDAAHAAPAACRSARAAPTSRSPISSRRSERARRLHRRLRGHRRHRRGRDRRPLQARQRRLLRRSWSRRWPTVWPKPSPSACTSACARSSGAMRADETLEQRRADRREISRHPPGAGLSGAARPHREGHAVPAARRPSASASS